jgi:hypothetical protein
MNSSIGRRVSLDNRGEPGGQDKRIIKLTKGKKRTSENAASSQIWAALIISVLLWICGTLDGITVSAPQILRMIKTTLLSKGSLSEICTNRPPPPKIASPQLLLEGLL